MSGFQPIFKASEKRVRSIYLETKKRKTYFIFMIKEQLQFSSILALGASLFSLLYLAIGRTAFYLAPALLVIRIVDAILQTYGVRKNPYMDNVLLSPAKYSAQYPSSETGAFSSKPADGQVVVFIIGARCNHPLGLLGPGWKELGDFFDGMVEQLEKDPEQYDYLGAQGFIADQRPTGNELTNVMYFKTTEGLHKYAHGALHKEGWAWWNKTAADHKHISIWHEIYASPKGMWESIYLNGAPVGFGSTSFPVKDKEGKTVWQNPLVDASRGVLRSSRGRMAKTDGTDHEKYDFDAYTGHV